MRYLFGEEGYALAINASIPDWFYEGDAVYNETFYQAGQGTLAAFYECLSFGLEGGKKIFMDEIAQWIIERLCA